MRELRTKHLVIMCSQTEKEAYEKAWQDEGYDSKSSWIRECLMERIKAGKSKK